jgi:hypothetical protein
MNNGCVSENFKNSPGNRQVCTLSSLFFVFSVEIMTLNLRNSKDIKVRIDKKKKLTAG